MDAKRWETVIESYLEELNNSKGNLEQELYFVGSILGSVCYARDVPKFKENKHVQSVATKMVEEVEKLSIMKMNKEQKETLMLADKDSITLYQKVLKKIDPTFTVPPITASKSLIGQPPGEEAASGGDQIMVTFVKRIESKIIVSSETITNNWLKPDNCYQYCLIFREELYGTLTPSLEKCIKEKFQKFTEFLINTSKILKDEQVVKLCDDLYVDYRKWQGKLDERLVENWQEILTESIPSLSRYFSKNRYKHYWNSIEPSNLLDIIFNCTLFPITLRLLSKTVRDDRNYYYAHIEKLDLDRPQLERILVKMSMLTFYLDANRNLTKKNNKRVMKSLEKSEICVLPKQIPDK